MKYLTDHYRKYFTDLYNNLIRISKPHLLKRLTLKLFKKLLWCCLAQFYPKLWNNPPKNAGSKKLSNSNTHQVQAKSNKKQKILFFVIFLLAGKCGTLLFHKKPVSTRLSLIKAVSSRIFRDLFSLGGTNSDDSFGNVSYDFNLQKFWMFWSIVLLQLLKKKLHVSSLLLRLLPPINTQSNFPLNSHGFFFSSNTENWHGFCLGNYIDVVLLCFVQSYKKNPKNAVKVHSVK